MSRLCVLVLETSSSTSHGTLNERIEKKKERKERKILCREKLWKF